MATNVLDIKSTVTVNALRHHEAQLRVALARSRADRHPHGGFEPGFELLPMSEKLREYFSVADLSFSDIGSVAGHRLVLLDLMRNQATRTTKTLASLVIVARAIRYIHKTGERVMILTPSSANKATALRDAVLRAYHAELVIPPELQIVAVAPAAARGKLWSSELAVDSTLSAYNPMCVLETQEPEAVKAIAREAADGCAAELRSRFGVNLWHTLDLVNYRTADAVRAFAESAALPIEPGTSRVHAHAVSSAFGLLGHYYGTTLLPESAAPSQYFLVQHLATPDMVSSLHDTVIPEYHHDPVTGLYEQHIDPRFPFTTFDPAENLEPTFYTRAPATSPAMNEIIRRQGGGGIVVSLHECLGQYARIRELLADTEIDLPADPRKLREWSLVMAMTGVLNGIDRGLLSADEVVVHGSGSYSDDDFAPIPEQRLRRVTNAADLRRIIYTAASGEAN